MLRDGTRKADSCPTKKQESADCFAFLRRGDVPSGVASLLGELAGASSTGSIYREARTAEFSSGEKEGEKIFAGTARRERQDYGVI